MISLIRILRERVIIWYLPRELLEMVAVFSDAGLKDFESYAEIVKG